MNLNLSIFPVEILQHQMSLVWFRGSESFSLGGGHS